MTKKAEGPNVVEHGCLNADGTLLLIILIVKIDKNIKWRADNQAEIVKYINNRENGGNNAQLVATSTMILATVLALNL